MGINARSLASRCVLLALAVATAIVLFRVGRWNVRPHPFSDVFGALASLQHLNCRIQQLGPRLQNYQAISESPFPEIIVGELDEWIVKDKWLQTIRFEWQEPTGVPEAPAYQLWSIGADGIDEDGRGDDIVLFSTGCGTTWSAIRSDASINDGYYWARYRSFSWLLWSLSAAGMTAVAVRWAVWRRACGPMTWSALSGVLALAGWCLDAGRWGDSWAPLNCLGFLIALPLTILCIWCFSFSMLDHGVRYARHRSGRCTECGYDLAGLAGCCPECGKAGSARLSTSVGASRQ